MSPRLIRLLLALTLPAVSVTAAAQLHLSPAHGLFGEGSVVMLSMTSDSRLPIRYTLDGSEPTTDSPLYDGELTLRATTIVRAAEVDADTIVRPVATASYLFVSSVLTQSDTPEGYPSTWGQYTEITGTAMADYGMDPELTAEQTFRNKVVEGLTDLPVLSIVTDRDNLFSHVNDSLRGGIYIFTGPPVGDATGHGWTRPASIELFGHVNGDAYALQPDLDVTADCGLRLHGGHGRLAEKNPKHSFRLVFKKQYGDATLDYPLFGDGEPHKFKQLVLRCHFGNAWQHWSEGNRQKAQYTRDVWARRTQKRLGRTGVNALYVHLFLNGMYWGVYNVAERVDDQYGKNHLGGQKSDIDVVKIEEDGGNHIEAAEGTLDAWQSMVDAAARADDDTYYYILQGKNTEGLPVDSMETLLDIDAFIDYMLINQYAGNTDWDHHNWYAVRRRGPESQGFRFLCWDSEIIFENVNQNVVSKNNGNAFPTGIFNNLLRNGDFARRYVRRARELLTGDGLLTPSRVRETWDSLYYTIDRAIYCEAARWGDYRRDVHTYTSRGELYTPDNQYAAERNRLLNSYFPLRSERVMAQVDSYVVIDDFEMPADWTRLTPEMFCEWDGTDALAQPTGNAVPTEWNLSTTLGGGGCVAGFTGVEHNRYADLSQYGSIVLRGSGSGVRLLANRLVDHGPWKQLIVGFSSDNPYWDSSVGGIVMPLDDLRNTVTNEGKTRQEDFLHLNAIKVDWGSQATVTAIFLTPGSQQTGIADLRWQSSGDADSTPRPGSGTQRRAVYNLNGQRVGAPAKGIYILPDKRKIAVTK